MSVRVLGELERLLLAVPGIVRLQQERSGSFVGRVLEWLSALETLLSTNRLYQAAAIASLRSGLLATERGQIPAEIVFRGRPTRSKASAAAASLALQRGSEVASGLILENRHRIEEAALLARQIIASGSIHGLLSARRDGESEARWVMRILEDLKSRADLKSAVGHLETLVGVGDCLTLLHQALIAHPESGGAGPRLLPTNPE